eukprot:3669612-Amphidinium_carterae.1
MAAGSAAAVEVEGAMLGCFGPWGQDVSLRACGRLVGDSSSSSDEGVAKRVAPPTPAGIPATPSRRWDFPKR